MSEEQITPTVRPGSLGASDLQRETKQHLQTLQQGEDTLSHVYELFAYHERVWPDQCKHIAILMQKLQKPVQSLFILLERPEFRTASIALHRQILLLTLQHVDEQITELPPLIMCFHTTCRTQTKQAVKQKEEIQHRLKTLLQEYNKTLHDISALSDILYFQRSSPDSLSSTFHLRDARR